MPHEENNTSRPNGIYPRNSKMTQYEEIHMIIIIDFENLLQYSIVS